MQILCKSYERESKSNEFQCKSYEIQCKSNGVGVRVPVLPGVSPIEFVFSDPPFAGSEVGGWVQPGNCFVSFVRASERARRGEAACGRETMCLLWLGVSPAKCAPRARGRARPPWCVSHRVRLQRSSLRVMPGAPGRSLLLSGALPRCSGLVFSLSLSLSVSLSLVSVPRCGSSRGAVGPMNSNANPMQIL